MIRPPRNPERIDEVLEIVKKAWEKFPDLRLAQLIGNVAEYYTEDDVLVDKIAKIYDVDPICPYDFSHTRHWCGHWTCRES